MTNDMIWSERAVAYMRFLRRAIVLARSACQAGSAARAEAILDAIHNVPGFLLGDEHPSFEADFVDHFIEPLVRQFPDLHELADMLPRPEK